MAILEELVGELMTADEAAKIWDVHITTVKRICCAGEVDAVKIGVSWVMLKGTKNPRT